MKVILLIASLLTSLCFAQVTVSDRNASLKVTREALPPDPNDQNYIAYFIQKLEWTVNGRRILVYPGTPYDFDYAHFHSGIHVTNSQIHLANYTSTDPALAGKAPAHLIGVVYTLEGRSSTNFISEDFDSRITEKFDIYNDGETPIYVLWSGMGFRPFSSSIELPDLTGLDIRGKTEAFVTSLSETAPSICQATILHVDPMQAPRFGRLAIFPTVSFSGFNPTVDQSVVTLEPCATLTVITELLVGKGGPSKVAPFPPLK